MGADRTLIGNTADLISEKWGIDKETFLRRALEDTKDEIAFNRALLTAADAQTVFSEQSWMNQQRRMRELRNNVLSLEVARAETLAELAAMGVDVAA